VHAGLEETRSKVKLVKGHGLGLDISSAAQGVQHMEHSTVCSSGTNRTHSNCLGKASECAAPERLIDHHGEEFIVCSHYRHLQVDQSLADVVRRHWQSPKQLWHTLQPVETSSLLENFLDSPLRSIGAYNLVETTELKMATHVVVIALNEPVVAARTIE
jgi:hypothetical protein